MKFESMQIANAVLFLAASHAASEGLFLLSALAMVYIGANYLLAYGLVMQGQGTSDD